MRNGSIGVLGKKAWLLTLFGSILRPVRSPDLLGGARVRSLALSMVLGLACQGVWAADTLTHRVKPGENLFRIGIAYGVTVEEICRANAIADPSLVEADRILTIPRRCAPSATAQARAQSQPAQPAQPAQRSLPPWSSTSGAWPTRASVSPGNDEISKERSDGLIASSTAADTLISPADPDPQASQLLHDEDWAEDGGASELGPSGVTYSAVPNDDPFSWPVQGGLIYSPFGPRRGRLHAGIDISAPTGTLVYAARDGVVSFSGSQRGYGKVIVVDHGDGFATLYAHNSKNLVPVGRQVVRGQMIARVGATGNATGSHCHFEIRKANIALDPVRYLGDAPMLVASGGGSARPKPKTLNKAGIIPIP